jgi:hypothetical protein
VPVTHTNTVAIRDGRLLAAWQAGQAKFFADLSAAEAYELQWRLRRIDPPQPNSVRTAAAQPALLD